MSVKELPKEYQPREKLIESGPESLKDHELLAILLRTGTKGTDVIALSQELISDNLNLARLSEISIAQLCEKKGIGPDKAVALMAAFEISKRILMQQRTLDDITIHSPQQVADFFIPLLRNINHEVFIVVCLNTANKIIRYKELFRGHLSGTSVHPREIFKYAITHSAASIILIHNHPSENPEPSGEDIQITKKIIEAGKMLEIPVFDHIIIAGAQFTSFAERQII